MENKNMELWLKVCKSNPNFVKEVNIGGRKFNAICAQSQIKKATELWGAMGGKWGIKNERINYSEAIAMGVYQADLFCPNGIIVIHSDCEIIFRSGKRESHYNEDWTKKIATDALTKGLSKLGFNSDIFEGKFDDNKYVAQMQKEFNGKPTLTNTLTISQTISGEKEKLMGDIRELTIGIQIELAEEEFVKKLETYSISALKEGYDKLKAKYGQQAQYGQKL